MLFSPQIVAGRKFTASAVADTTEALAFLARTGLTAPTDNAYISAYKTLINNLVSTGTFAKLQALYVLGTKNLATAQLSLVSSTYDLTYFNAPTFTADQGVTGVSGEAVAIASSHALQTSYFPAANATLNDHHVSVWFENMSSAAAEAALSAYNSGDVFQTDIFPRYTGDICYARCNDDTPYTASFAQSASQGHIVATRIGSGSGGGTTDRKNYFNAVDKGVTAVPSHAINASASIWLLGMVDTNTSIANGFGGRLKSASIGMHLNSTQVTDLGHQLNLFHTAISGTASLI